MRIFGKPTPGRICLAGSGGGHVRQILDLEPAWAGRDVFLVTENTALGRSLSEKHHTHLVAHVAWGQAKLGKPLRMLRAGLSNAIASWRIVRRERPAMVVTTGAGSMAFTVLWARLTGARVVLVDSFARFDAPSLFARLVGPLAHVRIAQSQQSARRWRGALMFDPFRRIEGGVPLKRRLAFATVGATLPFDRLVTYVGNAARAGLLPPDVIVQTGEGGARPEGLEAHETLPFDRVKEILDKAQLVVCHAGTGSLITALQRGCHVIAIPREYARGEHYDDHQSEIAAAFASRGLIQIAHDEAAFQDALRRLPSRTPSQATTDPAELIDWLNRWFDSGGRESGL